MKKAVSILLAVLLVALCGCGAKDEETSDVTSEYVSPVTDFEYTENDDGITVTKYIGESTEVSVPATIDGKPVTQIDRLRYDVTSVRMPDTVLRISDHAFSDCEDLKTVHFSAGLLTIGSRAFYSCGSLGSVTLPERLEVIGYQAFQYCMALREVAIPKNVVEIEYEAFGYCPLEKITFAEDGRLESIGSAAFVGAKITEITVPASVKLLYGSVFADCTALTKVTLREGLALIGHHAFVDTALTEIVVPASVKDVYFRSFFAMDGDEKLKVYFEGDLPDDFFRLVDEFDGTLPEQYFDGVSEGFHVTLYRHEGAKGFGITDAHITVETW